MPEGHTLRRLADELDAAFAGRPVRVSSPQGRFAADAALLDGDAPGRRLGRQAPVRGVRRRPVRPRPPRSDRQVRRASDPGRLPVGQVRLRLQNDTSYADLRGAIAATWSAVSGATRWSPPWGRPAARRRRPDGRLGPDPAQPPADRRPAPGPDGDRGSRQRLPGRGPLPAPDPPAPARQDAAREPVPRDVGRPRRADARRRADRQDRHGPLPAHPRGDGPPAAGGRPRGRGLRLSPDGTALPGLRTRIRTGAQSGRNLFWCPRCQPTFRSRAVR